MAKFEWRFNEAIDDLQGFNDSGINTFAGSRLSSLVREIIQNSLDQRVDKHKPVKVIFDLHSINKKDTIEIQSLEGHIQGSLKSAEERDEKNNNKKATKFWEGALEKIKSDEDIKLLAIHDSNTTGLTGDTREKMGAWAALIRGTGAGITDKPDPAALGSFGIGAKAPYTVSDIRSAFYHTIIDNKGELERRFIGISFLQGHSFKGIDRQAKGYYGDISEKIIQPLLNDKIPNWAKKLRSTRCGNDTGLSILLPYYAFSDDEKPETAITVISNFFYAIKNGYLEVYINDIELNKQNIEEKYKYYFDQFLNHGERDQIDEEKTERYLSSIESIINPDKKGVIEVEKGIEIRYFFKLKNDSDRGKNKSVTIARGSGMVITDEAEGLKRFSSVKPFTMFVCVDGNEGRTLLREIENPAHDNFEFDRAETGAKTSKSLVEQKYNKIVAEIKKVIKDNASIDYTDSFRDNAFDAILGALSEKIDGDKGDEGNKEQIVIGEPTDIEDPGKGKSINRGGNRKPKPPRPVPPNPKPRPPFPEPPGPIDVERLEKEAGILNLRSVRTNKNELDIYFSFEESTNLENGNECQIEVSIVGIDDANIIKIVGDDGAKSRIKHSINDSAARQKITVKTEEDISDNIIDISVFYEEGSKLGADK